MQQFVWVDQSPTHTGPAGAGAARGPATAPKKRRSACATAGSTPRRPRTFQEIVLPEGSLRVGTDPLRCYIKGPRAPAARSLYEVLQGRRSITPALGLAAIKFFLDNGASPNESIDEDRLPVNLLRFAAQQRDIDAIRLLASYGADPCRIAVLTHTIYVDVTLALLELGADPHQASNGGHTAATRSARFCGHASRSAHHLDILELLLRFSGDADVKDDDGYTPMMAFVDGALMSHSEWKQYAPEAKWARAVGILLSAGAALGGLTNEEMEFLRYLCLQKLP